MCIAVIEGGDVVELFTAEAQKFAAVLDLDLVQGFEAIGRKPGADDIDRLDAALDQLVQHVRRIRLNPGLLAEA